MGHKFILVFFTCLLLSEECKMQTSVDEVELRRGLVQITQEMLIEMEPLHHSYIFNSGVGNREELRVDSLKKESQFVASEGVVSWQSVKSGGLLYLLGRKPTSVSLLVYNTTDHFFQHSLELVDNISSTSLFLRWNSITMEQEVIAAVAVQSASPAIKWFRVTQSKQLEEMIGSRMHRPARTNHISAFNTNGTNQLVIVDSGPNYTNAEIWQVFGSYEKRLDFRMKQMFQLEGECASVTVCNVGMQQYLVFLLPVLHSLTVFTATNNSHFQHLDTLSFPGASQVISFTVGQHVYFAVNGEKAAMLRVTDSGDFIKELSCEDLLPGYVSQWLAVPVSSYRNDVLLFSRNTTAIKTFVWAGTNNGFVTAVLPNCSSCLEGDWSGVVSVLFRNQQLVLLPKAPDFSSLLTLNTTLHSIKNPMFDKISSFVKTIKELEARWDGILSKLSTVEEVLKYTIIPFHDNVITEKWEIRKLLTPKLQLNAMLQPSIEEDRSSNVTESSPVDVGTLSRLVQDTVENGKRLVADAITRREQVWGLQGFQGKISFKGNLHVMNLTVTSLNNHNVETFLSKSFRKNKPQPIRGNVIMHSLQADNVVVKKVKNFTTDKLKFNDDSVRLNGNVTFTKPVVVKGDIELKAGGQVNGVQLFDELCNRLPCSVAPAKYVDPIEDDADNTIVEFDSSSSSTVFDRVEGGKNLNVKKVNNVSWDILLEMVVFKHKPQNIDGNFTVKGTVSSDKPMLCSNIKNHYTPKQRDSDVRDEEADGDALPGKSSPPSADSKFQDGLLPIVPNTDYIFTNLEVSEAVICGESEWGVQAADVVLSDANTIDIPSWKSFKSSITANNLDVHGLLAGVNTSELLTKTSDQVFQGPIVLQGNITLENVTLTGLWNKAYVSIYDEINVDSLYVKEIKAQQIRISETLNDVPVYNLLTTDKNNDTSVKSLFVQDLVVVDTIVAGKVCGKSITDFEKRRFSVRGDQNVTGKLIIGKADVVNAVITEKLNNERVDTVIDRTTSNNVLISALHVEGNITTEFGMNGFNLNYVHHNAVHLNYENHIRGHLIFKDEVAIKTLHCQGFFNDGSCDRQFKDNDVVYKTNETIFLSGKMQFLNPLTVSDDLFVNEINGHNTETILTTASKQDIKGDITVVGDMRIDEDCVLMGLLNTHNITKLANACNLTSDTIICRANVEFKEDVSVDLFNTPGEINGVKFDHFIGSLVDPANPVVFIYGFKNFTGKTVVENMKVNKINDYVWEDFLKNAVSQDMFEHVNLSVVYDGEFIAEMLVVVTSLTASSFHGVDLRRWYSEAIHIDRNITLNRTIHLMSASSKGNLKVVKYGDLEMIVDLVQLNGEPVSLEGLSFMSINVTENINVVNTVNGYILPHLEKNTLKISGNQTLSSPFVMMRDLYVAGDLITAGRVSGQYLQDVVTLSTNQTLNGNYYFDCIHTEDLLVSGLITQLNMSEWEKSAVLKSADQEISGAWYVNGSVELRGPVRGKGRLGDTNLDEQEQQVTQHILDTHKAMKVNLSSSCKYVNNELSKARSQSVELAYLEPTQDIQVPTGVSLVVSFQNGDSDYLSISERGCLTTLYKWEKDRGFYSKMYQEKLGFNVEQLLALHKDQLTYLISVSSKTNKDCYYTGGQVWLFTEDKLEHISSLELASSEIIQVYNNTLFSSNKSAAYRWDISTYNQTLQKIQITQAVETAGEKFIREEGGLELALQGPDSIVPGLSLLRELKNNCTNEVHSVSVDPSQSLVAVLTTEKAQIPRHWDLIKVYRLQGGLYDEMPAQKASHLGWLPVPHQTWLAFLQNQSSIELYHLQGVLKGFQHKMSVPLKAEGMSTLALPLVSRVSPQPYLLVQTNDSVRVLQAVFWGDPFLGPDLTCDFDQLLSFCPDTL